MPFFDQYPYTNFHNVNLDWILERVKEWGQMVEDNNTRFENLEQANADFKEYVTNYIENLDYQAAVDDKLDRMFESGVLGEYLQPYVSPVVTTWLDQHITEPEGVVIDTSLTVAGAAADSKATGDADKNLQVEIETYGFYNPKIEALLNCFRHVAWINGNGKEYYDKLENELYLGDIYNKKHWSLLDGLTAKNGNIVSEYFPLLVTNPANPSRALIVCNSGKGYFYNYNNNNPIPTDPPYYPVPVPNGSKRLVISTPSNFTVIVNIYRYIGNNQYEVVQNGQSLVGGGELTITATGSNLFIPLLLMTSNSQLPNYFTLDYYME